jgi:preprotein translocase subunit SecE
MNRAVRRKQAKQPKSRKEGQQAAAPPIAAPSTSKQAPSKRERAGGRGLLSWRPRFVMDIVNELRKVVWPTRDDVAYLTVVVVIIAIIFGAALGAIDIGFGWVIEKTILN